MTFENIVAKGEISHDEQFLILSHYFQLYSIIILSFTGVFPQHFWRNDFKVVYCIFDIHVGRIKVRETPCLTFLILLYDELKCAETEDVDTLCDLGNGNRSYGCYG